MDEFINDTIALIAICSLLALLCAIGAWFCERDDERSRRVDRAPDVRVHRVGSVVEFRRRNS